MVVISRDSLLVSPSNAELGLGPTEVLELFDNKSLRVLNLCIFSLVGVNLLIKSIGLDGSIDTIPLLSVPVPSD